MKRGALAEVFGNWGQILQTQNLSVDREMDPVSRWLLITRASVLPMTVFSALIGGLLAVGSPGAAWALFSLAVVGLVIAHAANNMLNDFFDLEGGVDSHGYVRTVYAPHPIVSGLISRRGLIAAVAILQLLDLGILILLVVARGPGVIAFALSGLFISVFYVAPPLKLKHHGLGEPAVFVVWGPLMVVGTYFVTTGEAPAWVVLASVPYGLLVTTVLLGKHIDKLSADAAKGIRTLPVILGEAVSLAVSRALMVAFYACVVGLVATGLLGVWNLVILASVPRMLETLRAFAQPRPDAAPPGYPIWPLWYVAWAFRLTRQAGGLLVLGLVVDAFLPFRL